MARFFDLQMFSAILIAMMALTAIGAGIAMLVIGPDGITRAVGIIPITVGTLLAWLATAWAMDV